MKYIKKNVQIIKQSGKPVFAVVPFDEWLELTGQKNTDNYIPHEVVGIQLKNNCSLIGAWRVHKGITQKALSEKIGMTQAAVSQLEKPNSNRRPETLKKVAGALGVTVSQITE